jgi:hypothetical protein
MGKKGKPNANQPGVNATNGNAPSTSTNSKARRALRARDANQAPAQTQGSGKERAEAPTGVEKPPKGRRKPIPARATFQSDGPSPSKARQKKPRKQKPIDPALFDKPAVHKPRYPGPDKFQKQCASEPDQSVICKPCALELDQANPVPTKTKNKTKTKRKKKTQAEKRTMPGLVVVPGWDAPTTSVARATCKDASSDAAKPIGTFEPSDGRYGVFESRIRLEEQGFHHRVTDISPEKLYANWAKLAKSRQDKPTIDEEFGDVTDHPDVHLAAAGMKKGGFNRVSDNRVHMLLESVRVLMTQQASIFLSPDFNLGPAAHDSHDTHHVASSSQGEPEPNLLNTLEKVDAGTSISTCIFHQGYETVKALALSSKRAWRNIAASSVSHSSLLHLRNLTNMSPSEYLELHAEVI